jgi:hypothetical protein
MKKTRVHLNHNRLMASGELCIIQELGDSVWQAQPIVFEHVEKPYYTMHEPTIRLNDETLQGLMNELWHAGFRPKDDIGGAGELGATKAHLKDMRAIAFNRLKMDAK